MKKILIISLCVLFALSALLAGCGGNADDNGSADASDAVSDTESKEVEMGDTYEYHGTSVLLPKGFSVSETTAHSLATPEDYPVHPDNVVITFEKRSKVADIEESSMLSLYKETDKDVFATLEKFDEFTKAEKDGHDTLLLRYTITYSDIEMTVTQYAVDVADGIVSYTFTSVTGEYADAFRASLSSIKVTE